jgi:hypothetical protein
MPQECVLTDLNPMMETTPAFDLSGCDSGRISAFHDFKLWQMAYWLRHLCNPSLQQLWWESMEVDQANEAEAKGGAEPARARNAAKKPDKARKQAGQIDSERLSKAIRYLQEHRKS